MIKIAMISQTWDDGYFKSLIKGFESAMKNYDVRVDIFNAYDVRESEDISISQAGIFNLPNPDMYDGLVLSLIGTLEYNNLTKVVKKFAEDSVPIISIDRHFKYSAYMGIDNEKSEYEVVSHMIKEHGCRTFQYVGGPENGEDDKERFKGFKKALKDNKIEMDERYIGHYSFVEKDGREAYRRIVDNKLPLPDAVICANDLMAMGYIFEAEKDGHTAPKDFRIGGFDNMYDADHYYPSVTSVNRSVDNLGYTAMNELLDAIVSNRPVESMLVPGTLIRNESCGCAKNRSTIAEYRAELRYRKERDARDFLQKNVRDSFCSCMTVEELKEAITHIHCDVKLHEVIVCLNTDFDNENLKDFSGFTDDVNAVSENGFYSIDKKNSVFPIEWNGKTERIFIYSCLHFKRKIMGYCVIPYSEIKYIRHFHSQFVDSISMAAWNIRQRSILDGMNRKFKELYVIDQLTGLYNRFGFNAMAGKLFAKEAGRVYIVYVDIDNLKKMNDNFGHDMGDLAIKGTASCILKAFDDTDIHVRMGGDEFLIMGSFTDVEDLQKREKNLVELLNDFAKKNKMPVALEASIGHSFNINAPESTELERMMKVADSAMYEFKQNRKNARKEEA